VCVRETVAEVLAEHGARQLHVAETEKYAHVTYFFNGGREDEWPGERRILIPSPRDGEPYEKSPEMPAHDGAAAFAARSARGTCSGSSTSRTRTWSATPDRSRPRS